MNIQYDLFDDVSEMGRMKREAMEKLEALATGKYTRGLSGKKMWEVHDKKMNEFFGDE